MMIRNSIVILTVGLALVAIGCDDSKSKATSSTGASSAKVQAKAKTSAKSTVTKASTAAPTAKSAKAALKPADVDPKKPVPVADLHAAVTAEGAIAAWKGKEVQVKGYYKSTTTSTNKHGKTARIDLYCGKTRKGTVGCNMKKEPTKEQKDKLAKERKDVIVKGKIADVFAGDVQMEECVLINR